LGAGAVVTRTIVIALVLLAASPAQALDNRTPAERDRLIGRCISEYGAEHADRCVQAIDPTAAARRAHRDYYRRDRQDELARERRCWEDPTIINPRSCAEGVPPVRSRRP
jgi:hypothetical protein